MKYIVMFKNKKDKTYRVKEIDKRELSKFVKNYDFVFIQPNIFEEYEVPDGLIK